MPLSPFTDALAIKMYCAALRSEVYPGFVIHFGDLQSSLTRVGRCRGCIRKPSDDFKFA